MINSSFNEAHIDHTVTVSKEYVNELLRDIAEYFFVQENESIQEALGEEHPLSRLEEIFKMC